MPPCNVLIADDDPLLRAILEHKLSAAGYAVPFRVEAAP